MSCEYDFASLCITLEQKRQPYAMRRSYLLSSRYHSKSAGGTASASHCRTPRWPRVTPTSLPSDTVGASKNTNTHTETQTHKCIHAHTNMQTHTHWAQCSRLLERNLWSSNWKCVKRVNKYATLDLMLKWGNIFSVLPVNFLKWIPLPTLCFAPWLVLQNNSISRWLFCSVISLWIRKHTIICMAINQLSKVKTNISNCETDSLSL